MPSKKYSANIYIFVNWLYIYKCKEKKILSIFCEIPSICLPDCCPTMILIRAVQKLSILNNCYVRIIILCIQRIMYVLWIIVPPCPRSKVLAILRGEKLNKGKNKKGQIRTCVLVHLEKNSNIMQCKTGVGGVDFSLYHLIYYEFMW